MGIFTISLVVVSAGFLVAFVWSLMRDRTPLLESHWGGLGGGLSGWRVSPALLYLACTMGFALLATLLVSQLIGQAYHETSRSLVDKYMPAVRVMVLENVREIQSYAKDNKVALKGIAPTCDARDRVWEQIKLVNPALDDVEVTVDVPGNLCSELGKFLMSKYASVRAEMTKENIYNVGFSLRDNKLVIKGTAPTAAAVNRVWDQIKRVNPTPNDIDVDIKAPSAVAPAGR
ncbi:MAG: hypothetical protein M3O35_03280 [Acidobacteriota bacterium]|nr:hypothetical protein [Acidobacteriota bacterium]